MRPWQPADGNSRPGIAAATVIDRRLRTRRFLNCRESSAWARDAWLVVDALAKEVAPPPSRELVVLLERAVGHVVKVILHADDSDGLIGDLVRRTDESPGAHPVAHRVGRAFADRELVSGRDGWVAIPARQEASARGRSRARLGAGLSPVAAWSSVGTGWFVTERL